MFNNLFNNTAPLQEESIQWLFGGFGWALHNFGSDIFSTTPLIEPSNKFFPGEGDDVQEMAQLIFKQTQDYCGLGDWPCQAINYHEFNANPEDLPDLVQVLQSVRDQRPTALTLFYEPQQLANPNAMIANYVHALAHHLSRLATHTAPCEQAQWPHMMELLGVYMGFGIMFSNTAMPQHRGGCGSCHNPAQDRQGALSEMEVLYALAIFCALKDIPQKAINPHIKSYLRSMLKATFKDVRQRTAEIRMLELIDAPSTNRKMPV